MNPIKLMDGKKTATGGGLAAVTGLATAACLIWDIQSPVVDKAIDTVNLAAGFFGTTGIGHKAWKWFKRRK
jgi:UDP-N-acetylmuramyl pentapeptide phosphotransferase/UDP-N-acetylglucosamine-1-phosphate transferase